MNDSTHTAESSAMGSDSDKNEFDREFEFGGPVVLMHLEAVRHLAGTVLEFKDGMPGGGSNIAAEACSFEDVRP